MPVVNWVRITEPFRDSYDPYWHLRDSAVMCGLKNRTRESESSPFLMISDPWFHKAWNLTPSCSPSFLCLRILHGNTYIWLFLNVVISPSVLSSATSQSNNNNRNMHLHTVYMSSLHGCGSSRQNENAPIMQMVNVCKCVRDLRFAYGSRRPLTLSPCACKPGKLGRLHRRQQSGTR